MPHNNVLLPPLRLVRLRSEPRPLWSQQAVAQAALSLFPAAWTADVKWDDFPYLEDLLAHPVFTSQRIWTDALGLTGSMGPELPDPSRRSSLKSREGIQRGAYNSSSAMPPVISFGLSADEHFQESLLFADSGQFPLDLQSTPPHWDLKFAASMTIQHHEMLRSFRQTNLKVLTELAHRCMPLSARMRSKAYQSVQMVIRDLNVGLIAVLSVLMSWPGTSLVQMLLRGFPVAGLIKPSGVYNQRDDLQEPDIEKLFETAAAHNQ